MDARCPRQLNKLPTSACSEGRRGMDEARAGKSGGCPWFVADAEACYCFFRYMADNGQDLETERIARLLMIDDNEVKRIIQNFRKKAGTGDAPAESEEFSDLSDSL